MSLNFLQHPHYGKNVLKGYKHLQKNIKPNIPKYVIKIKKMRKTDRNKNIYNFHIIAMRNV